MVSCASSYNDSPNFRLRILILVTWLVAIFNNANTANARDSSFFRVWFFVTATIEACMLIFATILIFTSKVNTHNKQWIVFHSMFSLLAICSVVNITNTTGANAWAYGGLPLCALWFIFLLLLFYYYFMR